MQYGAPGTEFNVYADGVYVAALRSGGASGAGGAYITLWPHGTGGSCGARCAGAPSGSHWSLRSHGPGGASGTSLWAAAGRRAWIARITPASVPVIAAVIEAAAGRGGVIVGRLRIYII